MRIRVLGLLLPVLCLCGLAATAAETKDLAPEEIIKRFAAKEAEFAKARENYTYRQSLKIQELTPSGAVQGQHEMVSDIIFSPEGKRTEKVVRAPVSTLHLLLDPGDEQDLRNVQPFVLTTDQIPEYDIRYLGRQKVDEIPCYQFAVKPKKLEKGKRYFEGEIWVDDRDFQIVKTFGKGVGLLKKGADNQYPRFETYRQQIDGKYWFPTYTRADDTLHFKDMNQRLRMTVKYEDYKQFKSTATVTFGEEVKDSNQKPQKPPEKK
jgi:hypothetical protein